MIRLIKLYTDGFFGLNHSLPPLKLRKTDVFVSFEMIHRFLLEDLKNDADKPTLKAQLSHLANWYVHNYQPSRSTIAKHRILKKLRNDKEIVILRPDKGSGVVVLNRRDYEKSIKNLINDKTKFKELTQDIPSNENLNYNVSCEHWKIINVWTM